DALHIHNEANEGTEVGQYPYGTKAVLYDAIRAAQSAASDESSSQQTIDEALVSLLSAVHTFTAAVITIVPEPVDDEALRMMIEEAGAWLEQANSGDKVGQFPQQAYTVLEQALEAASVIYRGSHSQSVIDEASETLLAEMEQFRMQR